MAGRPGGDNHVEPERANHKKIPWWWAWVQQGFGMGIIAWEVVHGLDQPYILATGLALAVGGKAIDVVRRVLG